MKNRSLRFKITLWTTVTSLILLVIIFYLLVIISSSVLQKTIRNYLLSAVDSNSDKITYILDPTTAIDNNETDFFIEYKHGFLQIDDDFLAYMNDVESALYYEDGTLLYGSNPLAQELNGIRFSQAKIYIYTTDTASQDLSGVEQNTGASGKTYYYIYERKLVDPDLDGLWIRGVVPLTQEKQSVLEILRLMGIFLPTIIILSILLGYFIFGIVLKPIITMEQAASDISDGNDLKKRIIIDEGKDELHSLAKSYNAMLDRLEESFETEQRFTSDASHELRTPMSVILAQLEFTKEKDRTIDEYKQAMTVIERQGKRMNALIDDMLIYSRIDRRMSHYPLSQIDISTLFRNICEDMKLIKDNDITLEYDIEKNIVIQGNELLLTRMLQNLIYNAYKYGKEQGHIDVTLSTEASILLAVRDDGIGISEEDQKKIFDRFYQVDSSRTKGGLGHGNGLGLSMVKIIAEYHDAELQVESEIGSGSIFSVIFHKQISSSHT